MMNCGCSDYELREQKRIDEIITKQLEQDWHKHKWEKILLLLGISRSGKTTLMKQLRNVFGKGLSEDDRKAFIGTIQYNVLMATNALVLAMAKLSIKCQNPHNTETWRHLANRNSNMSEFSHSDYTLILRMWHDDAVHRRRRELQLPNSAKYFLNSLDRIRNHDYIPTTEDVLKAYKPTVGVEEHSLVIGSIAYKMVDVGRNSLHMQQKWMHLFEECAVSAVLFMVDICEYDQVTFAPENERMVNCLENAKLLFQRLSHYQYENFKNSVFMLLFNKEDTFDEKILYSNLSDHFPAYTGPNQNPEMAKNFICDMFIDAIPDKCNHITIHFISATHSNSAREVCKAVKHEVSQMYQFNSLEID